MALPKRQRPTRLPNAAEGATAPGNAGDAPPRLNRPTRPTGGRPTLPTPSSRPSVPTWDDEDDNEDFSPTLPRYTRAEPPRPDNEYQTPQYETEYEEEDTSGFGSEFSSDYSSDYGSTDQSFYTDEEDDEDEDSGYSGYQDTASDPLDFDSSDSFGVEATNEVLEEPAGEFGQEFAMDYEDFIEGEPLSSDDELDPSVLIVNALREFPEEITPAAEAFFELINDDDVSEVMMNAPNRVTYKRKGQRLRAQPVDFLTVELYHRFINEILLPLTDSEERIDGTNYLIEGQLTFPSTDPDLAPAVARVHMMTPPVVPYAKVTIAKKSRISYTLDDMKNFGSMTENMMNFLKCLAHGKATVVFSGVSGAGKTTLIEAMSHYFDSNDRIIIVEDTPEIRIPSGDVVSLTAKNPGPGMDEKDVVTMEWLVKATNRMRPDRILVGECRGGEFAEFLIAANSGADGSMTTIHASTPRLALEKMVSLAMKSSTSKSESSVIRDINSTVQVVVQADIVDGKHVISSIMEVSSMTTSTGKINSQTIFEYDRMTQRFVAKNQPGQDLKAFLEQHGVDLPPHWFR